MIERLFTGLLRGFCRFYFKVFCRLDVRGLENLPPESERYVLVANHQSFLDVPLLLTVFRSDNFLFPMAANIAELPIVKLFWPLLKNKVFVMDPANPMAIRDLIRKSQSEPEKRIVIFPEGRITLTGTLMKVYSGAGMLADKTDAKILPVRVEGLQFSKMSRLTEFGLPRRWFPKVRLSILPLTDLDVEPELVGRARRIEITEHIARLMAEKMYKAADTGKTLYQAVTEQGAKFGWKRDILKDSTRKTLTYRGLAQASCALGSQFAQGTQKGEIVGLMLPNTLAAVASFFALQREGRVPAMLNFTAGISNLKSAVVAAEIKKVYTARKFVEMAKLGPVVEELSKHVEVIYLEDVKENIRFWDKLKAFVKARRRYKPQSLPTDPAVVLFTSGSEGAPKGVVLSHKNLLSNVAQVTSRMDFGPGDKLLSAMPLFHSFGLTGGMILPLLTGTRIFLYPSPLHFRVIPELVYDFRATIMFGTDTFLRRYAMFAHPYDFITTRLVFAGAEKLKDETRRLWAEKYGVRVLEGYGATETSPGLAANTLMDSKKGTVGRLLPGIDYRLHHVDGVEKGGKLHVAGPNIMLGYLKVDAPGKIQPPATDEEGPGWYDTGDIVDIDADGYVQVLDRVKRFAKVAGEMVPLGTVENLLLTNLPDSNHAIIAVEDSIKGEKLVLFTTQKGLERGEIKKILKKQGLPDLYLPREISYIDVLPLLGTGKTNYPQLAKLYKEEST